MNIMYHDHFRGWDPFRPTGGFVLLPPFACGRFTRVSGLSPGYGKTLTRGYPSDGLPLRGFFSRYINYTGLLGDAGSDHTILFS